MPEGEEGPDLALYGWDDEPRRRRSRRDRARPAQVPPLAPADVELMAVDYHAIRGYLALHGGTWHDGEARLKQMLSGALGKRVACQRKGRRAAWQLKLPQPGCQAAHVLVFKASKIEWYGVNQMKR
ncbi:hypothetical protein AB0D34_08050 [Streptomyces sp. NPDC048420]|uniref:hypothetical protein n=1 Tax=Streptomyces sp. NPDC048420 TaxID=3155755 RepID=UPI00343D9177